MTLHRLHLDSNFNTPPCSNMIFTVVDSNNVAQGTYNYCNVMDNNVLQDEFIINMFDISNGNKIQFNNISGDFLFLLSEGNFCIHTKS